MIPKLNPPYLLVILSHTGQYVTTAVLIVLKHSLCFNDWINIAQGRLSVCPKRQSPILSCEGLAIFQKASVHHSSIKESVFIVV